MCTSACVCVHVCAGDGDSWRASKRRCARVEGGWDQLLIHFIQSTNRTPAEQEAPRVGEQSKQMASPVPVHLPPGKQRQTIRSVNKT